MRFGSKDKSDKIHLPMFPSTSSSGSSLGILGDLLTCKYDEMKQHDYESITNNTISVIKDSYDSFISDSTKRVSSSLFSSKKNSKQTKYKQKHLPISVEEIQYINYNNIINGNIRDSRIPTISSIGDISPLFRQDMVREPNSDEEYQLPNNIQNSHNCSLRKFSNQGSTSYQIHNKLNKLDVLHNSHSLLIEPTVYESETNCDDLFQNIPSKENGTYSQDGNNSSEVENAYTCRMSSPTEYRLVKSTNIQDNILERSDFKSNKTVKLTDNQLILPRDETVSPSSVINCYLELEPQNTQLVEQQIRLNSCEEKYKALQEENETLKKQNRQLASQLRGMSTDILHGLGDRKQGHTTSKLLFDTISLKRQLATVTQELLELKTLSESQKYNI